MWYLFHIVLIAQGIEQFRPKEKIWVRVLVGTLVFFKAHGIVLLFCREVDVNFLRGMWRKNKAAIIEYGIVSILVAIVICGGVVAFTES